MKTLIALLIVAAAQTTFAAEYAQSGREKTFKGPEGETVTTIPLDNNTKMLVYAHNTYGVNAEKILVYEFRNDPDPQVVFTNPNQKNSWAIVMYKHKKEDQWIYADFMESKIMSRVQDIKLTYSEELSAKIKPKDLIKRAKDFEIPRD